MDTIAVQQVDLHEPSGNNTGKWARRFVLSAGVIFLVTGLAKIISAFGKAGILNLNDPVFGISFRHLMLSVGVLELVVSAICLCTTKLNLSLGLTIWLAMNFVFYRAGLWCLGWNRPCSCLGNITDAVHISPQTADWIMKIVLAYLLAGSFAVLLGRKVLAAQWLAKLERA